MFRATSTFSLAERAAMRLKSWKMKPIVLARKGGSSRSPSAAMSVPFTQISPALTRRSPPSIERKVVFPLPEGPITSTISPRARSRSRPRTASTRVSPSPNVFARLWIRTSVDSMMVTS